MADPLVIDDVEERFAGLRSAGTLVALVFAVGIVGFKVIGGDAHTWVDSIYMTTITLTTVGYAEVIEVPTPAAKLFTSALLIGGVGSFVYLFSNLTAFMVEGGVAELLRRRRARRKLGRITGHAIVAGAGATGIRTAADLLGAGHAVVAIDRNADRLAVVRAALGARLTTVHGDASDDLVLRRAGIERCDHLAACVGDDADNLMLVVSARRIRPNLAIVARCSTPGVEAKIRAAGAGTVVSPNVIAGRRLAAEVIRPAGVSFVDKLLDPADDPHLTDVALSDGSALASRTLGDWIELAAVNVVPMGLRCADQWVFTPGLDERLAPGTVFVFIGTAAERQALARLGDP